jgi:hypothetical protein
MPDFRTPTSLLLTSAFCCCCCPPHTGRNAAPPSRPAGQGSCHSAGLGCDCCQLPRPPGRGEEAHACGQGVCAVYCVLCCAVYCAVLSSECCVLCGAGLGTLGGCEEAHACGHGVWCVLCCVVLCVDSRGMAREKPPTVVKRPAGHEGPSRPFNNAADTTTAATHGCCCCWLHLQAREVLASVGGVLHHAFLAEDGRVSYRPYRWVQLSGWFVCVCVCMGGGLGRGSV